MRNGKGTWYYDDGKIRYEGNWVNDMRDGNGKYYYEDGSHYDGDWQESRKHGQGVMTWRNGNTFKGEMNQDACYKGVFDKGGIPHHIGPRD